MNFGAQTIDSAAAGADSGRPANGKRTRGSSHMSADGMDRPVLVLGGTGKTGRRVAARLTAGGVPVRIGSRSGEPPFDWEDPSTWAPALRGARSVYVSYYPDIAAPGAVEKVGSFAALAVARG